MMHLSPFSIYPSEDSARPDRHAQHCFTGAVLSSLPAHDIEDLSGIMVAIVIELEPIFPGATEDPLVNSPDRFPPAHDAAHGIVHDRISRRRPVPRHQFDVPGVTGLIEVGQRSSVA